MVGTPVFSVNGSRGRRATRKGRRVGFRGMVQRARGLVARCVAAGALGAAVLCSGPQSAAAQGMVRNTFGDWQLRCETPAGAKAEQCAMVQYLAAEDRPNLTLVVIVLKTADNRGYLLRVVAPLGVLLPSGLGLKIDKIDVGRAGFVRCLTTGCVAEVVMDDGLVKQFSGGAQATFIVFQTPEEGVGIPLSMKGFAQGFESLK
jgi:invasion protein IalB